MDTRSNPYSQSMFIIYKIDSNSFVIHTPRLNPIRPVGPKIVSSQFGDDTIFLTFLPLCCHQQLFIIRVLPLRHRRSHHFFRATPITQGPLETNRFQQIDTLLRHSVPRPRLFFFSRKKFLVLPPHLQHKIPEPLRFGYFLWHVTVAVFFPERDELLEALLEMEPGVFGENKLEPDLSEPLDPVRADRPGFSLAQVTVVAALFPDPDPEFFVVLVLGVSEGYAAVAEFFFKGDEVLEMVVPYSVVPLCCFFPGPFYADRFLFGCEPSVSA